MKLITALLSLVAASSISLAHAATTLVDVNALNSVSTLGTPFQGNESLLVNTLVVGPTGALSNTVNFTVGAGVTSFTGGAAWEVGSIAAQDPRLIGVNIDIFNSSNVLVASDAFVGALNGFAVSSFAGAIGPGSYSMVMTGTGVRTSSMDVSLTFVGTPSSQPPFPSGSLNQSTTIGTPIGAGGTVLIDSSVVGSTGPLRDAVTFTAGAGVTGFTSQAAWEVTSATDLGPRLTGVNVDLLDSANNVVFSDVFGGTLGSFALSSFTGALDPGTYTLVATGTAVRDVFLDVSLTLTGTIAAIPEPETYAMLLAGLGLLGFKARRREQKSA